MLRYLFFTALSGFLSFSLAAKEFISYEPAEHTLAGDFVFLRFLDNERGEQGRGLVLPNGLMLTYGDIIALGDFYGAPGSPISVGETREEQSKRFLEAFNSFARDSDNFAETLKIISTIHKERETVEEALKQGKAPWEFYEKQGEEHAKTWNCLTGGACSGITWWLHPGRYLKLANTNFDHFGNNALVAYQVGHELALETAKAAHFNQDEKQLMLAYAINAFACHFFTDRFSAGHIRTPRSELYEQITPRTVGSLLAGFMHNEEGKHGLHVHNGQGKHWKVYGDGRYYDERNQTNIAYMQEALQVSTNAIFLAFQSGEIPKEQEELYYVPEADEIGERSNNDVASLFYWDASSGHLMRRKNLADPFDRHWTRHWIGWSTLVKLKQLYP